MNCEICNVTLERNQKRVCSHLCRRSLVRKIQSDKETRARQFVKYWKTRITPERLRAKLSAEFGKEFECVLY